MDPGRGVDKSVCTVSGSETTVDEMDTAKIGNGDFTR